MSDSNNQVYFLSKSFGAIVGFLAFCQFFSVFPSVEWMTGSEIHMETDSDGLLNPVTATVKLSFWGIQRTWGGRVTYLKSWQEACENSKYFNPTTHRICNGLLIGQGCQLTSFVIASLLIAYLLRYYCTDAKNKGLDTSTKASLVLTEITQDDKLDGIEKCNTTRKYFFTIAILGVMTTTTLCFLAWSFVGTISDVNTRIFLKGADVKSIHFATGYYFTFLSVLSTIMILSLVLVSNVQTKDRNSSLAEKLINWQL